MKNTKAIFNKELVIRIPFNDFTNTSQGKHASVKTGFQRKKPPQQTPENPEKVLQVCIERENFAGVNKRRTPLVKRLRKRKSNINYEDRKSSYEGTPLRETKTNAKLPIYKRIRLTGSKENRKDPYAFDVFDEKPKKHPKHSANYDRSMHEELARIEKMEKKPKKKKVPVPGYSNTVNTIVKVMERVKKNQNPNSNISKVKNNEEGKSSRLLNNELNLSVRSKPRKSEKNKKKGFDSIVNSTIKTIMEKVNNRKSNSMNNSIEKPNDSVISEDCKSSGHRDNIADNSAKEAKGFVTINSSGLNTFDTSYQSNDDFLSFDHHNVSLPEAISTPRINVLSNICITKRRMENPLYEANNTIELEFLDKSHCTLNTTQYTDDTYESDSDDSDNDPYFGFKEISTETPEKIKRKRTILDEAKLPCRFGENFTRNPHWLRIKPNGLPAVDQEMIIDEEFVKRIEEAFPIKPNRPEQVPDKNLLQTTISEFLENKENYLLDTSKTPKRLSLFDCDDFVFSKSHKKQRKGDVLKENSRICSTPKGNLQSKSIASPRLSFIISNNENEHDVNAVLKEDLHLFEEVEGEKKTDFSIKIPVMTYAKKPKKKRAVEEQENPEIPVKKKKKNAMTKAEKAAFEKWAEETNAMFSEVDKHELTIL